MNDVWRWMFPLWAVALCCVAVRAAEPLPSFPGAEGYGAETIGGRGGRVVHVTNLNRRGPGSFTWALNEVNEPRTIVFDVSGVIDCRDEIAFRIGPDNDHVTIAGETSPGGMDVIIGGAGEKENIGVFINETPSAGNFCTLLPRMKAPNPYAVGTRLEIFSAGSLSKPPARPLQVETAPLDGSPIHVGLGAGTTFDLRVTFPGREAEEFQNVQSASDLRISPNGKIQPGH